MSTDAPPATPTEALTPESPRLDTGAYATLDGRGEEESGHVEVAAVDTPMRLAQVRDAGPGEVPAVDTTQPYLVAVGRYLGLTPDGACTIERRRNVVELRDGGDAALLTYLSFPRQLAEAETWVHENTRDDVATLTARGVCVELGHGLEADLRALEEVSLHLVGEVVDELPGGLSAEVRVPNGGSVVAARATLSVCEMLDATTSSSGIATAITLLAEETGVREDAIAQLVLGELAELVLHDAVMLADVAPVQAAEPDAE